MREEIRKLFPLEFYINDKGRMVSEMSIDTLNKLSDEIIKLQEENEKLLKKSYSDDVRKTKAIEKLESIRTFGLRSGKTLFSTLINETIDILQGSENNE